MGCMCLVPNCPPEMLGVADVMLCGLCHHMRQANPELEPRAGHAALGGLAGLTWLPVSFWPPSLAPVHSLDIHPGPWDEGLPKVLQAS